MIKAVRFFDVFKEPEIEVFFSSYNDTDMCLALQIILSHTIRTIKQHFNKPPSINILEKILSDSVITDIVEKSSHIRKEILALKSEISLIEDTLKTASKLKIPTQNMKHSRGKSLNIFKKPSSAWRKGDSPSQIIQSSNSAVNPHSTSKAHDKNRHMSTEIYPNWWPELTSAEPSSQRITKSKSPLILYNNKKSPYKEYKKIPIASDYERDTGLHSKKEYIKTHRTYQFDEESALGYKNLSSRHNCSPRENHFEQDAGLIETTLKEYSNRSPRYKHFEQDTGIAESENNRVSYKSPRSMHFEKETEGIEKESSKDRNKSSKSNRLEQETVSIGDKLSGNQYKRPKSNRFEQDSEGRKKIFSPTRKKNSIYNRYEQELSVSNQNISSQVSSPTSPKIPEAKLDSDGSHGSVRNNNSDKISRNNLNGSAVFGKLAKESLSSSSTSNYFPSPEMRSFYQTEIARLFGQNFNESFFEKGKHSKNPKLS